MAEDTTSAPVPVTPAKSPESPSGNASMIVYGMALLVTTALLAVILIGGQILIPVGAPLMVTALMLSCAGLGFGIRSWRRKEEWFRYVCGMVLNGVLIMCLIMMVVIYVFLRVYAPDMI